MEHNIWTDPHAAARVRAVTGGDETVPTVLVGTRGLVNPSVSEVVTAVQAEFPDYADRLPGPAAAPPRRAWWGGAAWTVAMGVIWIALALWRPTTTWRLAPALVAGAWPFLLIQARPRGGHRAGMQLLAAAAAGLTIAATTTLGLSSAELLRGPLLPGFSDVRAEAMVLAGGTATLLLLIGLAKVYRAAVPATGPHP